MSQPLTDEGVLTAARSTDATTSALAHEVVRARGLSLPLRITGVDALTAADAPTYGPTGWSRHDDGDYGTVWYVRLPVLLDVTGLPDVQVPPTRDGMTCEIDRDEVIAEVVCSLTCERDYEDDVWDVDNIAIRSAARVVELAAKQWDRRAGIWVEVYREVTRTPIDVGEVDRALFLWAGRHRRVNRIDLLAVELRQSAVEIVETDSLHDAEVTL
jgi:hypothetical protein